MINFKTYIEEQELLDEAGNIREVVPQICTTV